MKRVKFASKADSAIVLKVVERMQSYGFTGEPLTLQMDIEAAHCNGMPLKLEAMLTMPEHDLKHDIYGIQRHIDRKTGKLGDCFVPRCAAPERNQ